MKYYCENNHLLFDTNPNKQVCAKCGDFPLSCKCSVIAGNVVPNPECPVHVEVAPVAPSRSAAPLTNPGMDYWWNRWIDSEEPVPVSQMRQPQAMTAVCYALDFAQWFAERCAEFGRDYAASAAPPSANYVQEVRPDDPPPSCHRCGAVMVPTRFNCRSCGATTEPTEAAPPSEREAAQRELKDYDPHATEGESEAFICGFLRGFEARAAVPQDRASIEQQAAYYFSEIRKFSPLNLDHYSLENWKDFIVWRAAVPQAAADREAMEAEFLEKIKQDPTCRLFGMTIADVQRCIYESQARAAAVPAPGETFDILVASLQTIADFGTGNGDVCEIIAKRARAALAKVELAGATAPPKEG